MYSRLTEKINRNCNGTVEESTNGNVIYTFKGVFNQKKIHISVKPVSKSQKSFEVLYNNEIKSFTSEKDTLKYLTSLFASKKNSNPAKFDTEEMHKEDKEDVMDDIDKIDEYREDDIFDDEITEDLEDFLEKSKTKNKKTGVICKMGEKPEKKRNRQNDIKACLEYIKKNKIGNYIEEQPGYLDETMPKKDELETLAKGVKKGVSSNWYTGRINLALKHSTLFERYRIVYIKGNYYGYDKKENKVITLTEMLELMPNEIKRDENLRFIYETNKRLGTEKKKKKTVEE